MQFADNFCFTPALGWAWPCICDMREGEGREMGKGRRRKEEDRKKDGNGDEGKDED